jgi:Flp pilus assembly protein TadD
LTDAPPSLALTFRARYTAVNTRASQPASCVEGDVMRSVSLGLYGFTLAFVCLVSSGNAFAQAPPSSLQVMMPNGGSPSRPIRLTLLRDNDGFRDTVFTDEKGIFLIATPKTQTLNYTVTIESDRQNYDTTVARFRLDRNIPGRTTIFLKPLTVEKRTTDTILDAANFEGSVPAKAHAAYKRAMDAIGNGQFESAISNLQQATAIYPQYVRAFNDLGVVFMKLNRLDEAAATFKKAIDIDKRFFHPHMNLGIVLTKQGKYREAADILEPLYNENRGMMEVRLAYAKALEGAGELPESEKVYSATLTSKNLPPATQADLHLRLGVVLNREGKFADAITELEKATALEDGASSHLQLGFALMQAQQPARAERELLRAYQIAGQAAGAAQLMLGHIYYSQHRLGEAQRAFEQYLKDVPSAPNASEIAKQIADLKTASKN